MLKSKVIQSFNYLNKKEVSMPEYVESLISLPNM